MKKIPKIKVIAILTIIILALTLVPTTVFAGAALPPGDGGGGGGGGAGGGGGGGGGGGDTGGGVITPEPKPRLEGTGRVETALDISNEGWTRSTSVVLAPADQNHLVDALAAAPLAGQENAPILLTFKSTLNPAVKQKIIDLGVTKVYIVGAISAEVAAEVDNIPNVEAVILKGNGRTDTAKEINKKLVNPAGSFIVGYEGIPDALSVASYAAKNRYAIILSDSQGTVAAGDLLGSVKYIVGGTARVKDIAGVERISGLTRFETNKAVVEKLTFDYTRVYIANGLDNHLVDALSVASLAAKYGSFVALTDDSEVAAAAVINPKLSTASKVIAVGGSSAVSEDVKAKIGLGK